MNTTELLNFIKSRPASPELQRFNRVNLHCYGCAHSASSAEFPGHPSGERPCVTCIRNPEVDANTQLPVLFFQEGDDGHARVFNPFAGTLYNGAPRPYFPMDNYVTMDQRKQEEFLDAHPEYVKPVRIVGDRVQVVEREEK